MPQDTRPPIHSSSDEHDAKRIFVDFYVTYQPTLSRVEQYLEQVIEDAGPNYARAYRPWKQALHDLFRGIYLTAKNIPLPNPEGFAEALRIFSFDSAIQFLYDLCRSCGLNLEPDWTKRFREHINALLSAHAILHRERQAHHSLI